MEIAILAFGQIAELTGKHSWYIKNIPNTASLRKSLETEFPAMAKISYVISVNKKIIKENTVLTQNCTVALLPPFSGG